MMMLMQKSQNLLVLLLVGFMAGIVLSGPSNARRSRVRRQNMKVRINATGDTIVMKFLRPSPDTKLEGYILGYGGSMFSKQYIQLPENGEPYETEIDAEPKYLIAVQPVPVNEVKKQCSGKVQLKKPLHLVIGSVTPTSVLLSWGTLLKTPYEINVMDECVDDGHYTVRYREQNNKWNYQTCPTSNTVIDHLKPNTAYEFGVQPNAQDINGVWSKPVIHNTSMEEKAIQTLFKPRPVKPAKPVVAGRPNIPFSPHHVLHNRTQSRLPSIRKITPKTTLAPTTRQASHSTPLPTVPVVTKRPIGGGEVKRHGGQPLSHPQQEPQQKPQSKIKSKPQPTVPPWPQYQPPPKPQPQPRLNSQLQYQPSPKPQPQPRLNPQLQYQPPPKPQPQPQPRLNPQPQSQPPPKPQPQSLPKPKPQTPPKAQPQSLPKPKPQPPPKAQSQPPPTAQPQPQPRLNPQPQSQPPPKPQPQSLPKPKPQTPPKAQHQPPPTAQPQPQPRLNPQLQYQPSPKPQTRPRLNPQPQSQPPPKPQPQSLPKPKPQPPPKAQPQPPPTAQPQPQPKLNPQLQYQPSPKPQTRPRLNPQPQSQPPPKPQPQSLPKPKPQPPPTAQPQPQPKLNPQLQYQPSPKPQTRPRLNLQPQSQPPPKPQPQSLPKPKPQTPPKAQPQPPPTAQPQPQPRLNHQLQYQPSPKPQTRPRLNPQPQSQPPPKPQRQLPPRPKPQPPPKAQPQPTAQPQPQPRLNPQPQSQPPPKPKPQPPPKPKPQTPAKAQPQPPPTAQPQPQPRLNPQPQSQPPPKPKPQPPPKPKPQTPPKAQPQPPPTAQPQPQPRLNPQLQYQPSPKPQTQPRLNPQPQSQPPPKPQPQSLPKPKPQPPPKAQPQPPPTAQPQPQPKLNPHPKPQLTRRPKPQTQPEQQHQPTPWPKHQVKPQLKTQTQPQPQPQIQPTPQLTRLTQPQTHPRPTPQSLLQTETQAQPKAEVEHQLQLTTWLTKIHPHIQTQPQANTHIQSVTQPQSQSKSKHQSKYQSQPQRKNFPKPQPNLKIQPKPKLKPKKQEKSQPQPKTKTKLKQKTEPKIRPQPVSQPFFQHMPQPQTPVNLQTKSQTDPLPESHPQSTLQPQLAPQFQPQTKTPSHPTMVTPRQAVPTAPSRTDEVIPLPRPALAMEKARSNNQGNGTLRSSSAALLHSTISSAPPVPPAGRNLTPPRPRVPPVSTRKRIIPFSPPRTVNSSLSSITTGADGEHHRGNALPKPVMWSKDKPGSPVVLHPLVPVNKRPNLVGKPTDHVERKDKPLNLKQGVKESTLKLYRLATAKPKQEHKQTTTYAPALNSTISRFDIFENSSIFSSSPATEVDAMGKKRFVAPHVVYKTDKKPEEPCSITTSLSYFLDEEAGDLNVTGPPRIPPSNLTVVTVEGCPSFVILDWQKSDNETREYEVLSTTKGPNGHEKSILTTNQTHTAVENLKPESSYEFTVTPKNELGTGPSTDPVSFSTESADPRVSEYVPGKDAIWTQFSFKADAYSECNGKQFVKRTWYRKFVGIQLCNSLRYKIYLSDTLNGKFYNIGDQTGYGEDHCQFVDSFLDGRTGTQLFSEQLPSRSGFFRAMRQEPVTFGDIGGRSHITYVAWYECGTPIPGKW